MFNLNTFFVYPKIYYSITTPIWNKANTLKETLSSAIVTTTTRTHSQSSLEQRFCQKF